MKRGMIILLTGVALSLCAYCGFYFAGTASHRAMLESTAPELTWLKNEFKLSEAEFNSITDLHAAYLPQCAEMCRRIDAKNAELQQLLSKSSAITPEIESKLAEVAQIRVECQKNMLRHFFEVGRSMPSEQGRRYLAWVQARTFLPEHGMHRPASFESPNEHSHR